MEVGYEICRHHVVRGLLRVTLCTGTGRPRRCAATTTGDETVAPAIPGVVAAGTKVAIVKDGLRSSEGPILMPDGTTLFTEPGASRVHKIDKWGQCRCSLKY